MKNTVKRICAALLVSVLVLGEIPMDTFAKESTGTEAVSAAGQETGYASDVTGNDGSTSPDTDTVITESVTADNGSDELTITEEISDETDETGEVGDTEGIDDPDRVTADKWAAGKITIDSVEMSTNKLLKTSWTNSNLNLGADESVMDYGQVFVCKGTTDQVFDDAAIWSIEREAKRSKSYWVMRTDRAGNGKAEPIASYNDSTHGSFYGLLKWDAYKGAAEPELKPGDVCSMQVVVSIAGSTTGTWKNLKIVSEVVTFKIKESDNPKLTIDSLKLNPQKRMDLQWHMEGLPEEDGEVNYSAKIGVAKGDYSDPEATFYNYYDNGWWEAGAGEQWANTTYTNYYRYMTSKWQCICSSKGGVYTGELDWRYGLEKFKDKEPSLAAGDTVTLCIRIYSMAKNYEATETRSTRDTIVYEYKQLFKISDFNDDLSVILDPTLKATKVLTVRAAFRGEPPHGGYIGEGDDRYSARYYVYVKKGDAKNFDWNNLGENYWYHDISGGWGDDTTENYSIFTDTGIYWNGAAADEPGLKPGDTVTMGLAIKKRYENTTLHSNEFLMTSDLVTFQVYSGTVKQPTVSPTSLTYDLSEGTVGHKDLTILRKDGSYTFSNLKYGDKWLSSGRDYTGQGNNITLTKAFLNTLTEGTHQITLHYADPVEDIDPVDPVVTITVGQSCAANVIVKDRSGNDVTANCSITWYDGDNSIGSKPLVVTDAPKNLTYKITPRDSLKTGSELYYTETRGTASTKKGGNKVTVNLTQQGKVQLTIRAEGTELSKKQNGGYSVTWYTKDADLAKKYTSSSPDVEGYYNIGSGSGDKSESPMAPKGTTLFYDVNMSGKNATDYRDIIKASVAAGYGISTVVADATKGENIVLNVSGNKRSGEALTANDYTIRWYKKNADGSYEQLKHGRDYVEGNILYERDTEIGKTYYYEIQPTDKENVHNWFEFHGVRLAEATEGDPGTAVVPNGKAQIIDVALGVVEPVTVRGRITNSDAVLAVTDMDSLEFSLTQATWDGYAGKVYNYDQGYYYDQWAKIPVTVSSEDGFITFEATVFDLDTMVKIDDKNGNFVTAYKSIKQKDLESIAEVELTPAEVPQYLNVKILKQTPEDNDDGYVRRSFYVGNDFINRLEFELTNVTTGKVIDPSKYTIDRYNLRFEDMDYAKENVKIGQELKLTAKFKERVITVVDGQEIVEDDPGLSIEVGSDTMTVHRNTRDDDANRFDLVFAEYGKMLFTTTTAQTTKNVNEGWAVYDEAGNLVESKTKYYSTQKVITQAMPAGKYTLMVWRAGRGYSAASTLAEAFTMVERSSCQIKEFTVSDGHMTFLSLGKSPLFSMKSIFVWDETGFKDDLVQASLDEYKLFTVPYKVDPEVAANATAGTRYQFTMRKAHSLSWGDPGFYNVELKCRNGYKYEVAEYDPSIVVYDSKGNIDKDCKVTIDIIDGLHMATVRGFTLETSKPEGTICFYLKCATGGDHPVTVSGKIKDDEKTYSIGEINVRVDESGSISFASDYLHAGINTVWTYTVPHKKVQLYMDDVVIAENYSGAYGAAFLSFTTDDAFKAKFAGKDGWHLNGLHDLYTITDPDDANIRSEVSTLSYADANGYMPAVLRRIKLRTSSDYDRDMFSGRSVDVFVNNDTYGSLESQYWSPNENGKFFTYLFTATFDNADLIETNPDTGAQDSVYMWVTGQDDKEYPVLLKRKAGTNEFEGSITEEGLLFASWGINFKSEAPKSASIWVDDLATSTVVVSDDGTTAAQLYEKMMSTETDPDDPMVGCYGTMTEEELDEVLNIACDSLQAFFEESGIIPEGSEFVFDGSEESMRRLNEILGIREGTAQGADKLFDYEGWENWKDIPVVETKNEDGSTYSLAWTVMTYDEGYYWLEEYAVVLPANAEDPGYEMLQVTRLDESDFGLEKDDDLEGLIEIIDNERMDNLMADGHAHDQFAQYNAKTLTKMKKFNKALNRAIERAQGYPTRTSSQLVFLKNSLEQELSISGKSQLSQETAAISQMRSLVRELESAAKDGKFGAVSSIYEKRFQDYQSRLTKAEMFRDIGAGKQMLSEIKTLAETVKTAKKMLKFKNAKDVYEFLTEDSIMNIIKDLGSDVLKKDWKKFTGGLAGLALDKILDEAMEALDNQIEQSQQDVLDIMKEIEEDLAVKGLMKPSDEEKPEGEPQKPGQYVKPASYDINRGGIVINLGPSYISRESNYYGRGRGTSFKPAGGRSAAIHDPQGVVYEAVLSNTIEGATATLNEKTPEGEAQWNAEEFGQVNPQVTGADGMYQWFVPEGQYKVYVTAPAGSGLSDNDSSQHPAANLDDGSTDGWLPVLPVQLGINIPLYSDKAPEVTSVRLYEDRAVVSFSMYMDVASLSGDIIQVLAGTDPVICDIGFADEEESGEGNSKYYAKTMVLTPTEGTFAKEGSYTVKIGDAAEAYNHKTLAAYTSPALTPEAEPVTMELSKTVLDLKSGTEETVTVTLKDKEGKPVPGASVTASSSDGAVASVASAPATADGTVAFTVKALAAGRSDITFTADGTDLSLTLFANVDRQYKYLNHSVSWGSFDPDTGSVTASYIVRYSVIQGEEESFEEIASGPVSAVKGEAFGSAFKYKAVYPTRDPEVTISSTEAFDPVTGMMESSDYSYEGIEDGNILIGFEDPSAVAALTYTGAKLTPKVIVTNGTKILVEGMDYTVSYKKNINAGTATATVTLKGKSKVKKTLQFTINPVDLAGSEVMVGNTVTATGTKASPVLVYKGMVLKAKTDYTGVPTGKLSSDTEVTVTGTDKNFTGRKKFTVKVTDKKQIRSLAVTLAKTSFTYDGMPKTLTVTGPDDASKQLTVRDKNKTVLSEGSDFIISYADNVNAGSVKFVVVGRGTVKGIAKKSFKIAPAVKNSNKSAGVKDFVIINEAALKEGYAADKAGVKPYVGITAVLDDEDATEMILVPGRDYKVSYSNNKKAGTGKANITFMGNFKGSKMPTITFDISDIKNE